MLALLAVLAVSELLVVLVVVVVMAAHVEKEQEDGEVLELFPSPLAPPSSLLLSQSHLLYTECPLVLDLSSKART